MNEALITNWNNKVSNDSIVFHLGDFALGKNWKSIIPRLNGKIHLILGNHDELKDGYHEYFESIQEGLTISVNKKLIYLSHFPYLTYHGTWGTEHDCWNLIGHVHTLKNNNKGSDFNRLQYLFPTQYDVGVDFNDYAPVSYSEVKEKIDYQIKNNTNQTCWING